MDGANFYILFKIEDLGINLCKGLLGLNIFISINSTYIHTILRISNGIQKEGLLDKQSVKNTVHFQVPVAFSLTINA